VRDALRHLYDPVYLQTHPLTRRVRLEDDGGAARRGGAPTDGTALRDRLLEAIAALRPPGEEPPAGGERGPGVGGAWRRYRLLVLRYAEAREIAAVCRALAVSRREYDREHQQGLEAVVSLLGARWTGATAGGEGPGRPAPPRPPRPLTSLVGRSGEVAAVRRLLRSTRLLTLTGPASVGKTRLALEVAAAVTAGDLLGAPGRAEVAFVPLAAVGEPGEVPAAIGRALGVRELPVPSLARRLGELLRRRRLLVVLDNVEHLLPGMLPVLLDVLAAGEGLTVLATSRAALRLSGEQEFPVPPLSVPPAEPAHPLTRPAPVAAAAETDAVRLFVERARAISPAFRLTAESAPAVAEVCRRLDGLPLAIELAAAGVRLFSPQALLRRLDSAAGALPILASGSRDAPARHRTLRAAIAWGHDLLAAAEQTLFRRLGVFVGGFTLEAAEAVGAGDSGAEGPDVLAALEGLVAQSLVRREDDGTGGRAPGEPRYGML
jgi:predicted ATPase